MLTARRRPLPWMPRPRGPERAASFDHAAIEQALRAALVDGLGLKPRLAFAPVRAAITGRRISPPLFESMELLGRSRRWPGSPRPEPAWTPDPDGREPASGALPIGRPRDPDRSTGRPTADRSSGPRRRARPRRQLAAFSVETRLAAARRRDVPADSAGRDLRVVALAARRALRSVAVPAADLGGQPGGGDAVLGDDRRRISYPSYFREAFAFERPVGMLATNLGIAALIPLSWVLMMAVHQVRPRWLSLGRDRGSAGATCSAAWRSLLVSLNGVMLLSTLSTNRCGSTRSPDSGGSWW